MNNEKINHLLYQLEKFDTPTICNALELVDNNRKNFGYTDEMLFCLRPNMQPIVGIAKTATCRSLYPSNKDSNTLKRERINYYTYINDGKFPKIVAMQDLDGNRRGHGPFWGEFNTRIHKTLGCKGVITDGSIRDVPNIPSDFQILSTGTKPSHANIHIVEYNVPVTVASMNVVPGEIIHADLHGAVTFPISLAESVIIKAKEFVESESEIIEACKNDENLTLEKIIELYMKR